MTLRPLPLRDARYRAIRMLATDVDGTLTRTRVMTADVVAAIARLAAAGVELVPVSGRSAGEVAGLCRYLPGVERGLAENGLVEVAPDRPPRRLGGAGDRERLLAAARALAAELGVALVPAACLPFRLVDVAFERAGQPAALMDRLVAAAPAHGVHASYSTVHVHLSEPVPDKGAGVLRLAADRGIAPDREIASLGDAPNDEGLFVAGRFALTVGTHDVLERRGSFRHLPEWMTRGGEGDGFLELVGALLAARADAAGAEPGGAAGGSAG